MSTQDITNKLMELAQQDVDERWNLYAQLAGVERTVPHLEEEEEA